MNSLNSLKQAVACMACLALAAGCSEKPAQSKTPAATPVAAMPVQPKAPAILTTLADFKNFRPGHDVEIVSADAKAIAIKAKGTSPAIELPGISKYPASGVKIRLGIDVPDNTLVQIFYRSEDTQTYDKERSLKRNVRKGYNEIAFDLSKIPLVGRLRVDPGRVIGDYKISLLEVTAAE